MRFLPLFSLSLSLSLAVIPAAAADAFRVAVIADLNGEYGSAEYGRPVHTAVARIAEEKPGLVLIAGDMVSGGKKTLTAGQLDAMWAGFSAAVTDPLAASGVPVAPAAGNHDASGYPGYERERTLYERYWTHRVPGVALLKGGRYPFEYAFTAGGVLFIALDGTVMTKLSPERLAWLEGVLKASPEYKAKIVFTHVPLFPFAQGRETEATLDYDLDALLARYNVSAVVSGHHHAYYPGKRGAVKYAGAGCLGGGQRKLLGQTVASKQSFLWLTLGADGSVDVQALAYPGFSPILKTTLPEQVGSGAAKYSRDDL